MRNPKLNKDSLPQQSIDNTSKKSKNNTLNDTFKKWKSEINKLSYEKSLDELDSLLNELQNDQTSLEDIQKNYLKGNLYISHCQNLLKEVEQEIVEINLDDFLIDDD